MPSISRRDLLRSTLVTVSASSLLATSAWARAQSVMASSLEAEAALAPREKLLFDFDWKFQFGNSIDPAKDLGFGNSQVSLIPPVGPGRSLIVRPFCSGVCNVIAESPGGVERLSNHRRPPG